MEPRPMFEAEMEVIQTALAGITIHENDSLSLRKLLQIPNVPRAIKVFFRAEVEHWLKGERDAMPPLRRFNTRTPEIESLQQQIDMMLINRFEFDREDFLATLDKAIHFYFNYLLRPEWMLINFVYDNASTVPVRDILSKLRYCTEYLYYNVALERHFAEKGLVSVRVDEFRKMIHTIDDLVVAAHNSIELARMTTPIYDFLNIGQIKPRDEVNIDAVIVFFDDKRLDTIRERIEKEKALRGVRTISVWQLASIIEKVRSGNEDAEIEIPEQPVGTSGPDVPTEMPELPSSSTPAPEAIHESVPAPATPVPRTVAAMVQPRVKIFDEDGIVEKKTTHLTDIRKIIDAAEQKKIVKKIFKKNEVAFAKALVELNKMKTWKDAAAYLDEIFIGNDIDPYSKDAERFADIVYNRYPQEKKKQAP